MKRASFPTRPLFESGTLALPSSGRGVVWIIIARSTSSKCPRFTSSGLPPKNSSAPARRWLIRHSRSPPSSAGTAKNTTRPLRCSNAPASWSAIAAPSNPATCALWPHAWAAPVAGSASGCPLTTNASSSPISANVGPWPFCPAVSARTPVSASPVRGSSPIFRNVSSTSFAVFTSLKPSSGCRRIVSPSAMISSARRSTASVTRRFSSALVIGGSVPFLQQRECADRVSGCHRRGHVQARAVEHVETVRSHQTEADPDLVLQDLERAHESRRSARGQPQAFEPADSHAVGAQRDRLRDVGAPHEAAVDHDRGLSVHGGDDLGQHVHGPASVIELAS